MARSVLLLLVAIASGCFARNAAEPRFFRPESTLLRGAQDDEPPTSPAKAAVAIRLRGVESGPFLRERMVWRTSAGEYGLYEQRRWRETPATYVARALTSALQQAGRVNVTDDSQAPSLRVEVMAFDEVLAPTHVAVVDLAVSLRDKHGQRLLDRVFSAEAPIAADDPTAIAHAMGSALDQAAMEVATTAAAIVASEPHPLEHAPSTRRRR